MAAVFTIHAGKAVVQIAEIQVPMSCSTYDRQNPY